MENITENALNFPQIQVKRRKKDTLTPPSLKSNIYYKKTGGQRIKVVPKRTDLPKFEDTNLEQGSSSEQTVPVTLTASNSDSSKSNKRKSQHVVKEEIEDDVQFEGEEVKDEDTKLLMKNLAWLRVSLNYLLEEVGLNKVDFHGRPGKTKPVTCVNSLLEIKVKKEELEDNNKNNSVS